MAIVQSRVAAVQAIYAAYYNRPADVGGLDFWTNQLQSANGNLSRIINEFGNSPEANSLYTGSVENKVNQVYLALFGRPAEVGGLNFYVAEINAGRISLAGAAQAIAAGAQNADKTAFDNKVAAATLFTAGLDTSAEVLAYSQNGAAELGRAFLATVTATAPATQASVDAAIVALDTGSVFNLTAGTDVATANIFNAGLVQNASDRVNALQDEDVLTGTGTNPTLNITLGNANDNGGVSVTPTLSNIAELNVAFTGNNSGGNQGNFAANRVDLQDSTATIREINITRVTDSSNNVQIDNITTVPVEMSLSSIQSGTASVGLNFIAGAAAGAADTTTLTLSRVAVNVLSVEETSTPSAGQGPRAGTPGLSDGVETINLVSAGGANRVGTFSAEDLKSLVITGAQSMTFGTTGNTVGPQGVEATRYAGGLANVAGSLTVVDASALTASLDYTINGEMNAGLDNTSGTRVNMVVTGGTANDTFRLAAGTQVEAGDRINGGTGNDTLQLLGTNVVAAQATTNAPTVTGVENLDIRTGHDADAAADVVTVDARAIGDLATVTVRNEGQTVAGVNADSAAEAMTVNLNNVNAATANGIVVAHGTSGNNSLANNQVLVNSTLAGVTTGGVTITDGINSNPRFNLDLRFDSNGTALDATNTVVNVNLRDQDTESNTVLLREFNAHTGTLTMTGGAASQFLNLDSTGNAYRYDQTGTAVDGGTGGQPANSNGSATNGHRSDVGAGAAERVVAATIDSTTYLGDVIVRVSDTNVPLGGQNIMFGAGNDTVIFDQIGIDAVNRRTAGLTISDTVKGGAGTDILALDGNGVNVSIGASEWTNVSDFEIIRLVGNSVASNNARDQQNAYNLTLTNELLNTNGVADAAIKRITIVNDNDSSNDVIGVADDFNARVGTFNQTGVERGVTINATALNSNLSFRYNGEEGVSRTADRFIFSDANINGTAIIDGGRVYGAANAAINLANEDVIEIRNAAVATLGDLAGISNVGTLEFVNTSSIAQSSQLELNNDTLDRLVNDGRVADALNRETLTVRGLDNPNLPGLAVTNLTVNATTVTTAAFGLNVVTGGGADRVLINAASSGPGVDVNLGGQINGVDTLELRSGVAGETYSFNAAGDLVIRSADGLTNRTVVLEGVERVDITNLTNLSDAQKAALVATAPTAEGTVFFNEAVANPNPNPQPPAGGKTPVAIGTGTAPVAATAAAEDFSFNVATAIADAAGTNTQRSITGFATGTGATSDRLTVDLPTANAGILTLAQLNGQQGVTVQADPFANSLLVNFGADANGGQPVTLTLVGVTDATQVAVAVI